MNRKLRVSLSAFIVLSVLSLAVLVFINSRTKDAQKIIFTEDKKVSLEVDRVHYSGTRAGRVEWELDADSATRPKDSDLTIFKTVKVVFYGKNGIPYTLKAKEGRFSESKGEIEAIGQVTVESKDGYTVSTESLMYAVNKKEISSGEKVSITSEAMDLSGEGLLVKVDEGKLFLSKNVKAVIRGTPI